MNLYFNFISGNSLDKNLIDDIGNVESNCIKGECYDRVPYIGNFSYKKGSGLVDKFTVIVAEEEFSDNFNAISQLIKKIQDYTDFYVFNVDFIDDGIEIKKKRRFKISYFDDDKLVEVPDLIKETDLVRGLHELDVGTNGKNVKIEEVTD